jgi:hypothetical protein
MKFKPTKVKVSLKPKFVNRIFGVVNTVGDLQICTVFTSYNTDKQFTFVL